MLAVRVLLPAAGFLAFLIPLIGPSAVQVPAETVLLDSGDKEHKLKGEKWRAGIRHLNWLAAKEPVKQMEPGEEPKKGKAPAKVAPIRPTVGPIALEFREIPSTTFVNGVVTLIPVDRLRSLEYDSAKKTVAARVATGDNPAEITFTGSTQYKGINQVVLEAEVDRGVLGIAALKFHGGTPTGGFKKATFPVRMVEPLKMERPASVTILHEKKKVTQRVSDLQPLYQLADGTDVVAPALLFKKSLKVDLANVRKLVGSEPGQIETTFDVTLRDGSTETLTALNHVKLDGKAATLIGFVGKVPGAWKVYPLHTILELEFDTK